MSVPLSVIIMMIIGYGYVYLCRLALSAVHMMHRFSLVNSLGFTINLRRFTARYVEKLYSALLKNSSLLI